MKPKQQFMTIRNLAKRVNKDGFIIVLDSADAIHRPPGLKIAKPFYDNVNRPFGYKAMVLDMRRFEEGFQEYFRYENGRCNRMIPNLGNAAVRKAFQDVL